MNGAMSHSHGASQSHPQSLSLPMSLSSSSAPAPAPARPYGTANSMPTCSDSSSSSSSHARSSHFQAFSTTFKSIVGSGICALPFAVSATGWVSGVLGLFMVAAFSAATMRQMLACVRRLRIIRKYEALFDNGFGDSDSSTATLLVKSANGVSLNGYATTTVGEENISLLQRHSQPAKEAHEEIIGYRQLAEYLWGVRGRLMADIVLMTCQIGGNCAFIALIVSNLHSVMSDAWGWDVTPSEVLIGLFPVLCAVSLPRSTAYLAPVAHVGNIALFVSVCTVAYYGLSSHTPSLSGLPTIHAGWTGLFTFVGIAAFALCGHAEIMAVENDAADREVYPNHLTICMALIAALYASFSLLAFMCFGKHTASNILLNLGDTIFVQIVKISMSVVVTFNYPISLFPATVTLEEIIFGESGEMAYTQSLWNTFFTWNYLKGVLLRIITVAVTCLITISLNDFGLLTSIVGAITGGVLSFLLPPIFYYYFFREAILPRDGRPRSSPLLRALASADGLDENSESFSQWLMRGSGAALSLLIVIQVIFGLSLIFAGLWVCLQVYIA